MKSDKELIVTVHGTWGGNNERTDTLLWWEQSSPFLNSLIESKSDVDVEIAEFKWSGANSDRERVEASRKLTQMLESLLKNHFERVHIVAHSHGGNVVERCLRFIDVSVYEKIDTVVTVGCPFFKSHRSKVASMGLIGSAFSIPGVLSLIYWAYTIYTAPIVGPGATGIGNRLNTITAIVIVGSFLCLIVAIYVYKNMELGEWIILKINFWRRLLKPKLSGPNWLSIYHPRDEAIVALKTADNEYIEYLKPESIRKSFMNIFSSLALFVFGLVGILGLCFSIYSFFNDFALEASIFTIFTFSGLFAAVLPILWILFYGVIRIIESLVANITSKFVNGRVQAVAFGQDDGRILSEVSEVPHYFSSEVLEIKDTWADSMSDSTKNALIRVIENDPRMFFGIHTPNFELEMFSTFDARQLFDGLVHTTYFKYDQLVKEIVRHQKP